MLKIPGEAMGIAARIPGAHIDTVEIRPLTEVSGSPETVRTADKRLKTLFMLSNRPTNRGVKQWTGNAGAGSRSFR
jgi:hypothetical protein